MLKFTTIALTYFITFSVICSTVNAEGARCSYGTQSYSNQNTKELRTLKSKLFWTNNIGDNYCCGMPNDGTQQIFGEELSTLALVRAHIISVHEVLNKLR